MTRKKAFGMTEKAHGMFCAVMLNEVKHPPPHPVLAFAKTSLSFRKERDVCEADRVRFPSPFTKKGTSAKQTE